MRTIPFAATALAALAITPAAAASDALVAGRVVDRPTVRAGEVKVPLLVTTGGRSRPAALAVPRAALRRPGGLRLGDRVRGRRHRWLRVTARASAPTFARLDSLVAGTREAGDQAATDLRRVEQLPPGTLTGPTAVSATRADAEQRSTIADATYVLDERLAVVSPSGVEIPIGTVSTVSEVTTLLIETLRRLP